MTIEEHLAHTIPYQVAQRFGMCANSLEIAKDLVSFAYFTAVKGNRQRNLKSYVYKAVFRQFMRVVKKQGKHPSIPFHVVDEYVCYEYDPFERRLVSHNVKESS